MRQLRIIYLLIIYVSVGASCAVADDVKPYTVMRDDLAELKTDFNQAADQVRLLFIISPT